MIPCIHYKQISDEQLAELPQPQLHTRCQENCKFPSMPCDMRLALGGMAMTKDQLGLRSLRQPTDRTTYGVFHQGRPAKQAKIVNMLELAYDSVSFSNFCDRANDPEIRRFYEKDVAEQPLSTIALQSESFEQFRAKTKELRK